MFNLCNLRIRIAFFVFLLIINILEILSTPINMPETMPKPKVSLGKKISNMVHDAPIKIKNNLRATVHRESDKHFIYGEIHRVNANQAAKKGNHAQAAASNMKSTASYGKSLAYSKAGQKTKLW